MKTPKAPDPIATAQTQSGLNQDTALRQQLTNMVSTVNPWGNTTYNQTGSTGFVDSTGKYVSIPSFTQTTTLSPAQQAIFDKSQAAESNIAGIAQDQSAKLGQYLNDPFKFNNQDAANWAYDLGASRIRPEQERRREILNTRLVNSGIRNGSATYNIAQEQQDQADNDQWNQLALQGRGQAFSEALATRNQPINEITALLSGAQVSNPASMSAPTPQAQVAGVDYTGLVNQKYQAQVQNRNALLGGLFGLAGTAATFSDARLKTDISRIGTTANGLPWYGFRYLWDTTDGPMREGLMAQDVAEVCPSAIVVDDSGFLMVDYGKALQ